MASSDLWLGASYPSLTAMPAPNTWEAAIEDKGGASEAADGTEIFHERAQKWNWRGQWKGLTYSELNLLLTEYQRGGKLGMVAPNDGQSYTVRRQPKSLQLAMQAGTGGSADALYDVQITFREI